MSEDAGQSKDDAPKTPSVHTATLSEPSHRVDRSSARSKPTRPEPTTAMGKLWHNWVRPIGSVVVIVVVFRSMLLDWNDVPTGSMEPEIHVGDRIAVNRLAYGLQFPLTGPQIGIPFTPIQFDNPLDGIPQINWGSGPQRGDIVTFWNPVTHVRMVKRIVAQPGDTVAMNGGQLTINGQTATYSDLDPVTEKLPLVTKYTEGTQVVRKDLTYQSESLLNLTRTVQHIDERWINDGQVIAIKGNLGEQFIIVDNGWLVEGFERRQPYEAFRQQFPPDLREQPVARIKNGAISMQDKPASYNELANRLLAQFQQGDLKATLDRIGLEIQGHVFLIDGQPASIEDFRIALESRYATSDPTAQTHLNLLNNALNVLRQMLMTSFGPVTLGPDEYYMVGDNRNNSHDSRYFGPVRRSEITGEAFAVAFSFKDNKMLALPPQPAWSRFLKDLD